MTAGATHAQEEATFINQIKAKVDENASNAMVLALAFLGVIAVIGAIGLARRFVSKS